MIAREHSLTAVLTMHDINQAIRFYRRVSLPERGGDICGPQTGIVTPGLIEAVFGLPVTIAEVNGMPCVVPGTGRIQTPRNMLYLPDTRISKDLERVRLFHQFPANRISLPAVTATRESARPGNFPAGELFVSNPKAIPGFLLFQSNLNLVGIDRLIPEPAGTAKLDIFGVLQCQRSEIVT